MQDTYTLRDLYRALRHDSWRKDHPFSEDLTTVNEVLFDPYSEPDDHTEQLSRWFQGSENQPCLFGRVAAGSNWLHLCFLFDDDFLSKSDQEIAQLIRTSLLEWKRRSVQPVQDFSTPAFGFILIAASKRLADAAPDDHLMAFSNKLLELWGCNESEEPSGRMHWETLFLRDPDQRHRYLRFTFSVDFFAAQGDGRWWHDHRCPGGLIFTANSVGHMRRYREWYLKMPDQKDWLLQTAMLTIDHAAETPYGRATWLRGLNDGRPVIEDLACPFAKPDRLKPGLVNKDWTKYGGWLHTDHSIRPEFFNTEPKPGSRITTKEYIEDFSYLYDPRVKDHLRFVEGELVSEEEVEREIGPVADWQQVYNPRRRQRRFAGENQTSGQIQHRKIIDELLEKTEGWLLSDSEREQLLKKL